MNYIKKIGKAFIYIISSLFVFTFLFTLLNYIGIINYKVMNIFKIITLIISVFIGSFIFGRNSQTKGWLEGLKIGLLITIIFIIFNYIVYGVFINIKHIVYWGLILGTSVLGSILGINKKITNKS